MKTKKRIIALLQQDLKNHQTSANLEIKSRASQSNNPDFLDVVFDLMNVPQSAEIDWGKTYCNYMNLAPFYSIQSSSKDLKKQAELCFSHLQCIIDVELERQLRN